MNRYTRYDLFLQLFLHEKDDSIWQAELAQPVPVRTFRIEDLATSSNLLLRECNQNFAHRCGCGTSLELIGRPINHFIFRDHVSDVSILNDNRDRPYILKFRSYFRASDAMRNGYVNMIGLSADDMWIYTMLGRQYDITPEIRKHAEQQELKERLTVKEFEIFLSLAKGHTVKLIACNTGSTEKAVYYHIENMERKMKTQGIAGIIQKAYRLGFMDAHNG